MASSPSELGLTSLLKPRRATSTAMIGDMPFAKPMTDAAMQRMNECSAMLRNSMFTASGFMKPYEMKIPRNVPTSAAATFSPICSIGPAMDAMVMTMPSTAATIPKPGMASAALVSTATGFSCSSSIASSSISSSSLSWSGLILPSIIGRRPLQRNPMA